MTTKANGHTTSTATTPASKPRSPRKRRSSTLHPHARRGARSPPSGTGSRPGAAAEVEQFIEVLKSMKQGDFGVRFESDKDGVLGRAGELLNDIIGLNEHMSGELVRVGKVVGQEGKMHERASVGPAKGSWATGMASRQPAHRRPRRADQRGRARHHRRRPRRPLAEDGPRDRGPPGARRVPAHRHDRQQHGRSAQLVRRRGHARREGGRQRGKARRPGRRQGRLRHLEGPHRQRQRPRRQPHRPGPQHRQGHDRRRQGRPLAEDHRRRAAARSSSSRTPSTSWSISSRRSPPRSRASRRRSAPRESSAARPTCKGVSGTWKDLTDNVNGLAANLTAQVRNIAKVTTAVANGDLSQKITVDARGEIYELKNTINTMVDTLRSFAAEVTRVAKEVGTEGKLGGQADVKGVSGTWKDLTDNVNAHGVEPHRAGARRRRRSRPRSPTATCRRRSPSTSRARSSRSRTSSTRWSTSSTRSPRRSPASRRKSAPRASSAGRRTSRASPAPGRT